MKKKLEKSSGVKAPGSGLSAENKSDFNINRPYWSKTKFDTVTGVKKRRKIN